MAELLVVHDDSVISRTAYLLEQRNRRIELYDSILRGEPQKAEYQEVNTEAIQVALENERWLLGDLIEDIQKWLFVQELNQIHPKYVAVAKETPNDV